MTAHEVFIFLESFLSKFMLVTPESNSGPSSLGCGLRIYMYIRPVTSGANTHITRHILPDVHGFSPIATGGSVLVTQQRIFSGGFNWGFFFPSTTTTS